jgi:predicted flap endonuclease-1-like 5' DNA nuclease
MTVTLVIPSFPPAQLVYESLKIPPSTESIGGISVATIVNGVTNGFIWIIIGAALYGLACVAFRNEPLPPMPTPPHLTAPPPEPVPVDKRTIKIPPAITVRKPRRLRIEYDIETIQGIGPMRGTLFRNMGIKTVDDLLGACTTKREQRRLAKNLGVSHETLLKWIRRGDLLRVRGVGKQYSELLESAGVDSVRDLSTRNPGFLRQTLKAVNREKKLVKRVPPAKTIRIWVNNAQNLECVVE